LATRLQEQSMPMTKQIRQFLNIQHPVHHNEQSKYGQAWNRFVELKHLSSHSPWCKWWRLPKVTFKMMIPQKWQIFYTLKDTHLLYILTFWSGGTERPKAHKIRIVLAELQNWSELAQHGQKTKPKDSQVGDKKRRFQNVSLDSNWVFVINSGFIILWSIHDTTIGSWEWNYMRIELLIVPNKWTKNSRE
jgi:hypothetical protein